MLKIPNPDKHFASLIKQYAILGTLPDTDIILKKAGIGIPQLRNLMHDAQVETTWNTRLAGVTGTGFSIELGDTSRAAAKAQNFVKEMTRSYDFPTIIAGIMEAVAFGFCPVEILWDISKKQWIATEFIPKPPEWFCFSNKKELMFRSLISYTGQKVPENKFIIVQNRPSYQNPYGTKLFSKVYWPVTFKRNGVRWWTTFLERFDAPFIYGKFPRGALIEDKDNLLNALEDMISNSWPSGLMTPTLKSKVIQCAPSPERFIKVSTRHKTLR